MSPWCVAMAAMVQQVVTYPFPWVADAFPNELTCTHSLFFLSFFRTYVTPKPSVHSGQRTILQTSGCKPMMSVTLDENFSVRTQLQIQEIQQVRLIEFSPLSSNTLFPLLHCSDNHRPRCESLSPDDTYKYLNKYTNIHIYVFIYTKNTFSKKKII